VIDNPRIEALTQANLAEMFIGPGSISMALYIPFTGSATRPIGPFSDAGRQAITRRM
jgi:hypothetical protein